MMENSDNLNKPPGWGEEPLFDNLDIDTGSNVEAGDNDKIYDLVDIVEERKETLPLDDAFKEEIRKRVSETAERVAREMFPQIAERLIMEEIGKLKKKVAE